MKKCIFIAFSILTLFSACSKKSAVQFYSDSGNVDSAAGISMRSAKMAVAEPEMAMEMPAEMDEMESADISGNVPAVERKLVRNGSVNLEVDSLKSAREEIESWVSVFGGYVANSNESGNWLSVTARIPSKKFDEAMSAVGRFGRTLSRSVSTDDVTEQFYDLETRIQTKEVMLERMQNYLSAAKDVKDMIQIETKLNEVTSDLESMRGRMKRLSSQIDFSTITISAQLPVNHTEEGFVLPDTKSKFREFIGNILGFFVWLLFALLYVVVFGIPLVLVVALLFWLCFGKIGLVRKLFSRLRKN